MKKVLRLAPRDWIGSALVLAGFVLRLRQYLANRSLWLDEAMLANNILSRSFAGLTQQLSNDQGAPIGFLFLQKTITLLLGDSEYALRLLPFLAGCLSLCLMFLLVRKVASPFAGSLALALFAVSPALIYYSSEVKQYSSDVAIALALVLLFLKYERTRDQSRGMPSCFHWRASWRSGSPIQPCSFWAVWVSRSSSPRCVQRIPAGSSPCWWLPWHGVSASPLSISSTCASLPRTNSSSISGARASCRTILPPSAGLPGVSRSPFIDLLGLRLLYPILALLFLIGSFVLTRRLPRFGLFILLIFLLALFASFLELYPFAGRMILFLTPL